MDVFLIIKSPSQHVSDLTVQCKLNWSIQDVKECISAVYPMKPKMEHQKLIYCGRLLPNHLKLKDMLPNENGLTHTLHLVCNIPVSNSDTSDTSRTKINSTPEEQLTSSNNTSLQTPVTTLNFEGMRQRRNMDDYFDRAHMYSVVNNNSNTANAFPQMVAMQQAYAQFLNQYMLYVQSNGLQNIPNGASVADNQSINAEIRNDVSVPDAGRRPDNNQNNPANIQAVPIAAEADGNEVRPNRDFLDMIYVFARVTLLVAMLGFYSSLRRVLLVAGIALLMHLLHKRTQRRRNENAEMQRPQEANVPNEDSAEHAQQPQTTDHQEAVDSNEQSDSSVPERERSTETSYLALIRTFIIGFFSSLIPDAPVPVQVN